MSTHAPAGAGSAHFCEHCDDSVPHEHLDVPAVLAASRDGERHRALLELAVGLVLTVGAVVLAATAGPGPATALLALGVAVAGYAVATGAGLLAVGIAHRRTSDTRAVITGRLATAALTPVAALAVALLAGGGLTVAAVAGAAWLLCGAVTEVVRARAWGKLLFSDSPAGEHARTLAVARRTSPGYGRAVAGWAVQGVAVGLATWLLGVLPAVVVVLVPLAVAVAAGTALRASRD